MKNQNLKVGDILLCKKTYFEESKTCFYVNTYCTIYFIQNDYPDDNYYYICNYNNKNYPYPFRFSNEKIFTYFYTKNEIRKMKLENIYEGSKS